MRWNRLRRFGFGVAALVTAGSVTPLASATSATDYPPAAFVVSVAPSLVTPTAADSYYCSVGCTTSGTVDLWSAGYPAEITTLAHALHNNVDLIYEYVRNNIEYVPIYGLQKGALGAIIDQSGTAFDQAQLMVDLLRASGYTANYVAGTVGLSGAQIQAWLNVTDAGSLAKIFADGGIPAIVTPLTGTVTSVTLSHVWVSVTIGGTNYVFDPSYKPHTFTAPIAIATAMNWNSGDFFPATQAGIASGTDSAPNELQSNTTVQVPYVTVNSTTSSAIETKLRTYANNLLTTLRTSYATKQIDDVIGRSDITQFVTPTGGQRITSLPYTLPTTQHTWTGNIPNAYRTKLTVEMCGSDLSVAPLLSKTFYVDEEYGRRLAFDARTTDWTQMDTTMTWDYKPVTQTYTSTIIPSFRIYYVRLSVDHPYAATSGSYADQMGSQAIIKNADFDLPVVIVNGWGDVSPNLSTKLGSETAFDRFGPPTVSGANACGDAGGCRPNGDRGVAPPLANDRTQAQVYSSWLAQYTKMAKTQAQMVGGMHQMHHSLGVAYTLASVQMYAAWSPGGLLCATCFGLVDGLLVLDADNSISVNSLIGNAADRTVLVQAIPAAANALEGSIYEQQTDSYSPASVSSRFQSVADEGISGVKYYLLSRAVTSSSLFPGGSAGSGGLPGGQNALSVYSAITPYLASTANQVIAANNSFLGPGMYNGPPYQSGIYFPTLQRGGAFFSFTKPGTAGNTNVANIVTDPEALAAKGGGSGSPPSYVQEFSPTESADLLKDHFKDRSRDFGIDLQNGQFSFAAPADISVGAGGFPYELSYQRTFKSGAGYSPGLGTGWTHNLDVRIQVSGSGLEAFGQSSPLNAASTLAALYVTQQIYRQPTTPDAALLQNWILVPFVERWWTKEIRHNVVVKNTGGSADTYVRLADCGPTSSPCTLNPTKTYIPQGGGPAWRLVQTGIPVAPAPDALQANQHWTYSGLSFVLTSPSLDVQTFQYWELGNRHDIDDPGIYGLHHGWNLASWTFPYGMSVTFDYTSCRPQLGQYDDVLCSVSNSIGRKLTFSYGGSFTSWLSCYPGSVTDGNGRTASYTCDYNTGGFSQVTRPSGDLSQYKYVGAVTGARWYGYPVLQQVFGPSDQVNPKIFVNYDLTWKALSYQDAVSIQSPSQRGAYQFFITGTNRGERMDPAGYSYSVYYDHWARGIQYTDELGRVTSVRSYDGLGHALTRIYPELNKTQFIYDPLGNVTQLLQIPSSTTNPTVPAQLTINATYDPICAKITSVTDPNIQQTVWTYDHTTCLLQNVKQPLVLDGITNTNKNPITSYTYNSRGQVFTLTDPSGVFVQYGYDDSSSSPTFGYRLSRAVDPTTAPHAAPFLNLTTGYGYDPIGNITSVTDGRSNSTGYTYDSDRRVKTVIAPSDTCAQTINNYTGGLLTSVQNATKCTPGPTDWQITTTSYTPTDKVAAVLDPSNYETISAYDVDDRATDVTQCLTSNPSSTVTATCPGARRTTHKAFNGASEVASVYKGWGGPDQITYATYAYYANGETKTVADANSNITTSVYDGYDRLYRSCFPDSINACNSASPLPTDYEQYAYDNNGNLTSKQNRDGKIIAFTPDALNREINRSVPANTSSHFQRTLTTTYDLAGHKWDLTVTDTETGTSSTQALKHRYDAAGRLASVDDSLLAGLFNSGCITGSTNPASRCFGGVASGYDLANNRNLLTLYGAGGTTTYVENYSYDHLNRLGTVVDTIANHASYNYDTLSRRCASGFSCNWGNGTNTTLGYEANDDLKSIAHTIGAQSWGWTFTHNGAHQIIGTAVTDVTTEMKVGGSVISYSLNALNQYTNVGGAAATYAKNGSLAGNGTWTYEYDEENRLRKATGPHTAIYDYDPLGRRRSKTVDGATTYYTSDGAEEIAEWSPTGVLQARYVYGSGMDDRIVMLDLLGSHRYYYHADQHDSAMMVSDENKATTSYRYGAYGESADAATGNPFRYTGRRLDPETGLYFYRSRFYSPTLGRFLQTDTIGSKDDLDLYAYVHEDPLNNTDPQGTEAPCVTNGSDCGVHVTAADASKAVTAASMVPGPLGDTVSAVQGAVETVHALANGDMKGAAVAAIGTVAGVIGGGEARLATKEVISMEKAIDKGIAHVGEDAKVIVTPKGNVQMTNTTKDAAGNTVTKNSRFDVNPRDPHVQANGPHLNTEVQVNGVKQAGDPHTPIDPSTIRTGDYDSNLP